MVLDCPGAKLIRSIRVVFGVDAEQVAAAKKMIAKRTTNRRCQNADLIFLSERPNGGVHAAARNCDTRKLSMRSSLTRLACNDLFGSSLGAKRVVVKDWTMQPLLLTRHESELAFTAPNLLAER